ncbi:MAG: DUF695 domain-containing protein [Bacteroidales bacterium]|nr:DUF695 domain-containing protein [Bacteroidales bacterium]
MKFSDIWFSATAEADNGKLIFVTGRDDLNDTRTSGKYNERVEIYWHYTPAENGMPIDAEGELLETVLETLRKQMESKDHLAVLTGIYTGNDERTLVFYTRNSRAFGERLNEALAPFPTLPIELYVEKDSDWHEYLEMYEIKSFAE